MSDKEETVVLPNGTRKTFPAGTSDAYIDNWTERAYNRIESQQKSWADRSPADFARVMAGRGSLIGNVTDFMSEPLRYPEGMPLLGGKDVVPDVIGRGALSRPLPVALGDLATAATNIGTGKLNEAAGTEIPRLTPPSTAIGDLIGVKPQAADAGYLERILEALVGVAKNPLTAAGHSAPGTAAGVASSAVPYGQRMGRPGDVIDRVMENISPEVRRLAATRISGAAGRGGAAVGGVLGGDVGQYYGGDLGALLGSMTGSMVPGAAGVALRMPVQNHYSKPGDQSERALQVQEELGMTPTPGATGNARVSSLQSTAARLPVPFNPAAKRQDQAMQQYRDAGMETLNQIYDQGPVIQTPDVTGTQMRFASDRARENLDDYWNRGYAIVGEGVPPETRVWPGQTRQAVGDIRTPGSGESEATRRLVEGANRENVTPSIVPGFHPDPTRQDVIAGLPYADARPSGTDLFHSQERANPTAGGAINIMRRAFAGDTADMLLNDPWMLERFPDPADRIAKAERLQVLAREYAQEKARTRVDTTAGPTFRPGQGGDTGLDITQMDPGSMPPGATELPGGGSYRVLDEIDATKTGPSAFTTGKRPESMAVLQRNDQAGYPIIARNVIGNMWQDPTSQTGEIGPIQTANSWMPNTKGGISENAKGILANDDGQVVARGNLLAEGGNLLREQIAADKGSRTMPMMATAMLPLTAVTSPGFGLPALGAAYLGANAASGETFARYLARTAPQQAELLARKGVDSAMIASGQMADDEAMAMRAPVNPVEGGAAAYNQASGIARGAYDKLPRGTFWMPPVLLDQLYGP